MLQSLVNVNNVIMKQGHTNQDSWIQTGKPVSLFIEIRWNVQNNLCQVYNLSCSVGKLCYVFLKNSNYWRSHIY